MLRVHNYRDAPASFTGQIFTTLAYMATFSSDIGHNFGTHLRDLTWGAVGPIRMTNAPRFLEGGVAGGQPIAFPFVRDWPEASDQSAGADMAFRYVPMAVVPLGFALKYLSGNFHGTSYTCSHLVGKARN